MVTPATVVGPVSVAVLVTESVAKEVVPLLVSEEIVPFGAITPPFKDASPDALIVPVTCRPFIMAEAAVVIRLPYTTRFPTFPGVP